MDRPTAATGPYPFREHRTMADIWADSDPNHAAVGSDLYDWLDDSADNGWFLTPEQRKMIASAFAVGLFVVAAIFVMGFAAGRWSA